MPWQKPEFVRIYKEEKGIKKFSNFIEMINLAISKKPAANNIPHV